MVIENSILAIRGSVLECAAASSRLRSKSPLFWSIVGTKQSTCGGGDVVAEEYACSAKGQASS